MVFLLSSPSNFSLQVNNFRRTRICVFKEEFIQEKKQDKGNKITTIKSIDEKGVLVSNAQVSKPVGLPPLVSALKESAEENAASFHFPGHNRGRGAPDSFVRLIGLRPFFHDLPELPELDNLFCPEGPILEAQKQAAKLFGASETWFLVGGTTCGIQAAIMATCSPGDYLILPRNSHVSAVSAMVLSGAMPKYIIPELDENWDIAGSVTPFQVDKAIKELEMEGKRAAAVFVTSPTYHGICSNLFDISDLCHSYGIPVIIDEAHGAHFGFHPELPSSALHQGADLAVQSTHKVLCSLTQSSMLHLSGNLVERERICRCLQTLQTTSPSYLLLASLDAARAQLSENPQTIFNGTMNLAAEAKSVIKDIPNISVLGAKTFLNSPVVDPLRLTVGVAQLGLSGFEADEVLYRDHQIISELVGNRYITCAFNLGTHKDHVDKLVSGLEKLSSSLSPSIKGKVVELGGLEPFEKFSIHLSPREAFFARKQKMPIKESVGRICGELICPYPPGIPIMIPGEIITKNALDYLLFVRSKGATISGASDPSLSSIVVCNV